MTLRQRGYEELERRTALAWYVLVGAMCHTGLADKLGRRISRGWWARLQDARDVSDRFESLTGRERQVYRLLAEGNCNKATANRLNLSLHTVETHRCWC
jgi:FixJ family two-component response regulator